MHREYHPADMERLRVQAFGTRGDPGHSDGDGHHHGHDDGHDHGPEDRRGLYGLTGALGVLLAADVVFSGLGWENHRAPGGVSLALLAALIGGARIVYGAIEALIQGSVGADVALAQACLAALIIGEPFVAAEVVFIALVGEVLEAITFDRTQKAIHRLLDSTPRTARVRRDGRELEIPAGEVAVGDLVIVRPGEKIPVDGSVILGRSTVDQSALTGESIPVDKGPDDLVFTGTLNQYGVIEVRAEKVGHETTFGLVLKLVAQASKRKAPLERVADRLARYFLPVVETVAGLTLLAGWIFGWPDMWLRAVAVLVVACPCALILATPAAVLASMAWLARHGVLTKGGASLERLAACDTFAFDKTGTLTLGRPEVASLVPFGDASEITLMRLAATAEASGTHPLALAVAREAARRGITPWPAHEAVALPGAGVAASFHDEGRERSIVIGNKRLMAERGVTLGSEIEDALTAFDTRGETPLIVVNDGKVIGLIGVRDTVRPEAHDVIHDLKHLGIQTIAILTGDRASAAGLVAKKTHIKTVEAELLPADKALWIETAQAEGRKVAMVGDGINDAPALAAAHVGIALGGIGADLAAEAGDLIILGDPLRVLPDLVMLSRATVRVIRQNIIIFAFGLNAVAMGAAAFGILGPVPAAILHQCGSLLVLLNSMRLLVFGDWREQTPVRQVRALGSWFGRLDDHIDLERSVGRIASRRRAITMTLVLVGAGAFLTSGWTSIGPGEVGLVERFGRFREVADSGLHLGWPRPFERLTRLKPLETRSLEIGFRTADSGGGSAKGWNSRHDRAVSAKAEDESLLMTGDGQFVELAATAQYRLSVDPDALRAFAYGVYDPGTVLRPLAESALRSVVGRRPLDGLLAKNRREAEDAARGLLQARADAYKLGVVVTGFEFQDIHPPLPVLDAYRDVSRAESDRRRRLNEGKTYRAEALAEAKGRAATTTNRAEGERAVQVGKASGESDAFKDLAAARSGFPILTDQRLYSEALSGLLPGKSKLVIDPGKSRPRQLILPDFSGTPIPAGAFIGPPRPHAAPLP